MATGITESDVWTAADALLEGARPTIERVRQKIGRGSPNTVSPYLETWFKRCAHPRSSRLRQPGGRARSGRAGGGASMGRRAGAGARGTDAAQRDAQAELAAQRQANADEAERLRQHAWRWRRGKTYAAAWPWPAHSSKRPSRLRAAEAQCASVMPSGMRAQAQLAESRAAEQALQAQAEQARDAHAQAQSALESRHAALSRRWLNELDAERSAAKRLQSSWTRPSRRANARRPRWRQSCTRRERQQTGEREAQPGLPNRRRG